MKVRASVRNYVEIAVLLEEIGLLELSVKILGISKDKVK